jgi:hypothetical protein
MNPSSFSGPGEYQIVVQGHLDDGLSYWFEGLTVRTGYGEDGTPITMLGGRFVDQAALHGVLATIRDLNLPLISLGPTREDTALEPDPRDKGEGYSEGEGECLPK